MNELDSHYDVAIIGGRPAGASLAARLGARGLKVLVVDRAEFPSLPGVPSCPTIHPGSMRLLDEIGVDEAAYGEGVPKIHSAVIEFSSHFTTKIAMTPAFGRDYFYGIDRSRFDFALWKHLERYPTVTARQGFTVIDLIRDASGQVIGLEGRAGDGPVERIGAGWVVGADGRFSLVARKAGAKVTEEHVERTSTVYFADWEGVAPFTAGEAQGIHIFVTGQGRDVLSIPVPDGRVMFATHERADRVDVGGDAEAYYERVVRSCPGVARRLEGARRATPVLGIKRIANRYLEPGGPGWALTGDALHHKDPVDGQGIYDALIETKILAEAIVAQRAGEKSWAEAIAWYGRRVHEETHAMYLFTMDRIRRELYDEPPRVVIQTMIRWMMNDPNYQRDFVQCLCRAIPAEGWLTPAKMGGMMARGALRDLGRLWKRGRGREGAAA